jgi:hypothetical protein
MKLKYDEMIELEETTGLLLLVVHFEFDILNLYLNLKSLKIG